VVDTTGAGDSFNAGFLYGHLHGWPPAQCLAMAVACGAACVQAVGGVSAQPTLAQAEAILHAMGDAGALPPV
jgi:sugar/nucleoside kinase (ribokinase family)